LWIFIECKLQKVWLPSLTPENIYINIANFTIKGIIPHTILPYTKSSYHSKLNISPQYLPPEYHLNHSYYADTFSSWNLGILLYFVYYKKIPFYTPWQILHSPAFLSKGKNLSLDAKLFIGWCLTKNKNHRIKFKHCVHHPWITKKFI